jgi:hypothetical protein
MVKVSSRSRGVERTGRLSVWARQQARRELKPVPGMAEIAVLRERIHMADEETTGQRKEVADYDAAAVGLATGLQLAQQVVEALDSQLGEGCLD